MTDRRLTKQRRIAANVLPMQVWLEAAASGPPLPEQAKYPSTDWWPDSALCLVSGESGTLALLARAI
jgi:hypothetical protein